MKLNLLAEPLLSISTTTGIREVSLPEALAALGADEVEAFAALQPHQQHAWHAFTVQLAAIALYARGETEPPQSAETWAQWLCALTSGAEEPWCLVVLDLKKPAFMQPPVPEGSLTGWKVAGASPDELDVLVTAKSHDVKARRIDVASPEHWVYALVSLQTMQGYLGAGNYGIARMNGGTSNRPGIGLSDGLSLGARFRGDVTALLEHRDEIIGNFNFSSNSKSALIWTLPWDGISSPLQLRDCDPFFIEICRRVRLRKTGNSCLEALAKPTKVARFGKVAGLTGDPWTPFEAGKALTVQRDGFHYGLVSELLFNHDRYRLGAAMIQDRRHKKRDPHFIAQALVRGEGKTEGLHLRVLPLRPEIADQLADPEARLRLSLASRARIEAVDKIRNKVLKPALCALLQGAPEGDRLDYTDRKPRRWLDALEDEVDRFFFEDFFATYRSPEDDGLDAWKRRVGEFAHRQLHAAMHGGPVPVQRRYAAETMAEGLFHAAFQKQLGIPLHPEETHDEPSAA